MFASLTLAVIGCVLMMATVGATESNDASVRHVARSWRGGVLYVTGFVIIILAVASCP